MAYATTADLDGAYGVERIDMLADMRGLGVRDAVKITRALDDASALIDGYISQRYALPLPSVPAVLREACLSITVYKLATDPAALAEDMRARYEDALRFLRDVAGAKAALGLSTRADQAGGSGSTSSPQSAIVDSDTRMFSRRTMRGI